MEEKHLPNHLRCAYLGEESTLPVIISISLSNMEEEKLLHILKEHKEAIGLSLVDIKGIRPSMCMHRILLEEDRKLIYPISDSSWVSPVQVVPKKGGTTMIINEKNELLPTRTVTRQRICIDYRRLNKVTRNDHFPLPFIDQVLDRLAGNEYFYFLDGYSRYN